MNHLLKRLIFELRSGAGGRWLVLFGVCLACVWLYAPTVHYGLLYFDDNTNLFENPVMGLPTWSRLPALINDTQTCMRFQPISWISFSLLFGAVGLDPFWYHGLNVALQALNAGLLTLVLWRVFTWLDGRGAVRRNLLWIPLAVLLWAMHPLRVELVAWVSGMFYLQAFFWTLLSALCFQHAVEAASRNEWRRLRISGGLCLAFHITSLLVYPPAVGWPVAAGTYVFYLWSKERLHKASVAWLFAGVVIPLLLASFACGLLNMWVRVVENSRGQHSSLSFLDRVGQASYVVVNSCYRTVVPLDLTPVRDELVGCSITQPVMIASVLCVLVFSLVLIFRIRRNPGALCLWVAYLALLFPHMGWVDSPYFPADRYSYICGSLGCFALVWIFGQLSAPRQWWLAGLLMGLVCFACICTRNLMPLWKDTSSLLEHVVARLHNPEQIHGYTHVRDLVASVETANTTWTSGKPHTRSARQSIIARRLVSEGRYRDAVVHFREAIRLDSEYWPFRHDLFLGLVLDGSLGEAKDACDELRKRSKSAEEIEAFRSVLGIFRQKAEEQNDAETLAFVDAQASHFAR